MKRILSVLERVEEIFGGVFGVIIGVLAVLMTAEITMRYFNLGSMPWLIEIAEYLLCAGTFLAAPWVLRQGAHIRVDILLVSLPRGLARRVEQAVDLIGLGASLVFCYYAVIAVAESWRAKTIIYKTWWTPEWLILAPVPIACLLLSIEFLLRVFRVPGAVIEVIDPAKRASI